MSTLSIKAAILSLGVTPLPTPESLEFRNKHFYEAVVD